MLELFLGSPHMSGMASHPLGSPLSSYYSAGMGSMPGLSPNFGMPVSMMSQYSGTAATSAQTSAMASMGMSSSMAGLGAAPSGSSMPGQSLTSAAAYPSTSSPYPGMQQGQTATRMIQLSLELEQSLRVS